MDVTRLWPLAWQALEALTAYYGPAINHAAEALGIPYGEWYGWLMAARIFEPDPVSAERLRLRSAYTTPARLDEYLQRGVSLGLLEPAGAAGEYRLTEAGHAAVQRLIQTAYAAMAPLHPLPPDDLQRLADLLHAVVAACMVAPEPPGKFCLRIARHYDPGPSAPVMERLDQHLSDLNAYRDDSHLAAWRPLGINGEAWEAFTFVWLGEAGTLDELYRKLARRGYSRDDYAGAFGELVRRGWMQQDGNSYRLTPEGRAVRDEAEALTDRYFFAPFACLNDAEVADLAHLLSRFRAGLLPADA